MAFKSPSFSREVAARLLTLAPSSLRKRSSEQGPGYDWHFQGVSDVWRLTRYQAPMDELTWHFDAVKCPSHKCCSAFTLTIYLDTVAEECGGATQFDRTGSVSEMEVDSVQPVEGAALLLDHGVLHCGCPILSGVKHILRCEVFYESEYDTVDTEDGFDDLSDYDLHWSPEHGGTRVTRQPFCELDDIEVLVRQHRASRCVE